MITLKNVNKIYKNKTLALNNINIEFNKEGLYAIMGSSGSGKSTFLNILGMLDNPTSGILLFNNEILSNKKMNDIRKKYYGYIFQDNYLCVNLTVYENILLPILTINEDNVKDKIISMLAMVGIEDKINNYPSELSGGEKQRVALVRALIKKPKIILADEPTGNLDKKNEKIIFKMLKKYADEGNYVFIVSHSAEIKKYSDYNFYIENGELSNEK